MKKSYLLVLGVVAVTLLVVLSHFLGYPWWGRRLIYHTDSQVTKYPGVGEIVESLDEQLFVYPKGAGGPFFAHITRAEECPADRYEVTKIPKQGRISYVVGRFE